MSVEESSRILVADHLALFITKARQLQERAAFGAITRYKSSLRLSWSQESGIEEFNVELPDEEQWRSFLISFRHFIANDSPIQVNKTLKIVINRARHIAFRNDLIERLARWKEINNSLRDTSTEKEGVVLSTTRGYDLFLKWLNGTVFHCDLEAEEYFNNLGHLRKIIEFEFVRYVGVCTNFIVALAAVIESGLKTNQIDLLNKLSPHVRPTVIMEVTDGGIRDTALRFWGGTKNIPQNLYICEEHDQDIVLSVTDSGENATDGRELVKVELKGCCQPAIDRSVDVIRRALQWVDYLKVHGSPQSGPVEIIEVEVTDRELIDKIKAAVDYYLTGWRKTVGRLRCPIHHMPPGVRGFGIDSYHQSSGQPSQAVYVQGCCVAFLEQVLASLPLKTK
jgi:hypothetical protein